MLDLHPRTLGLSEIRHHWFVTFLGDPEVQLGVRTQVSSCLWHSKPLVLVREIYSLVATVTLAMHPFLP